MIKARWKGIDKLNRSLISVERKVDETTDDFLQYAMEWLEGLIRSSWGAGSAPNIVTGNLDNSFSIEKQGRTSGGQFATTSTAKKRFLVIDTTKGSNRSYSQPLEATHPYVQPALEALESVYEELAKRKIKVK